MVKCFFCYKKIKIEDNERYGIYLHQGTEDFTSIKKFVCQKCDRSLGDDDIKTEIAEILQQRSNMMNDIIKDLAKNKVKGFEHIKI